MGKTGEAAKLRRYALYHYAHIWLNFDGPVKIGLAQGLDGRSVRSIAAYYRVSRTLPGIGSDNNRGGRTQAGRIAASINEVADQNEQSSLDETARACLEVARAWCGGQKKPRLALSAASKFLWFAKPVGWTLYDSYVSRALRAGGVGAERKFTAFYGKLHRLGFDARSEAITAHLRSLNRYPLFEGIAASRILDSWLYFYGMTADQRRERLGFLSRFLTLLPDHLQTALEACARDMSSDGNCWFLDEEDRMAEKLVEAQG